MLRAENEKEKKKEAAEKHIIHCIKSRYLFRNTQTPVNPEN